MGIALAEPTLVSQVEQWGKKTDRPVENILEVAVQTYLDELEKEAIRAETQTFWAMHDDLLKSYSGEYIALYLGRVVAHDKDVSRLEEQVRAQYGLLPVLIAEVKPEQRRDLYWRGGKIDGIRQGPNDVGAQRCRGTRCGGKDDLIAAKFASATPRARLGADNANE